jgi:hypothetical protein
VKRRISCLVAGAALALVVSACGAASLPPWLVRHDRGVPPGVTYAFRDVAVWTTAGRMAVVTTGSSSCPGLPVRLDVPATNVLTVTVKAPDSGPCTADLAATTSIIEVPKALDANQIVTVHIIDGDYGATISLPARTGAGK